MMTEIIEHYVEGANQEVIFRLFLRYDHEVLKKIRLTVIPEIPKHQARLCGYGHHCNNVNLRQRDDLSTAVTL